MSYCTLTSLSASHPVPKKTKESPTSLSPLSFSVSLQLIESMRRTVVLFNNEMLSNLFLTPGYDTLAHSTIYTD